MCFEAYTSGVDWFCVWVRGHDFSAMGAIGNPLQHAVGVSKTMNASLSGYIES